MAPYFQARAAVAAGLRAGAASRQRLAAAAAPLTGAGRCCGARTLNIKSGDAGLVALPPCTGAAEELASSCDWLPVPAALRARVSLAALILAVSSIMVLPGQGSYQIGGAPPHYRAPHSLGV